MTLGFSVFTSRILVFGLVVVVVCMVCKLEVLAFAGFLGEIAETQQDFSRRFISKRIIMTECMQKLENLGILWYVCGDIRLILRNE